MPQPACAAEGAECSCMKMLACLHLQACCMPSTGFAGSCAGSYEFCAGTRAACCSACCQTAVRCDDAANCHSWQVWSSAVTSDKQPAQRAWCSAIISCSVIISCNIHVNCSLHHLRETRPCR